MKTKMLGIALAAVILALAIGLGVAGGQTAAAEMSGYDVALVDLDEPYVATLAGGERVTYRRAYLIRLHGTFPAGHARNMELYFGEERIEEYGSFPGGLYFMVYEKARLEALAGRDIRYRFDPGPVQSLGRSFQPNRFAPFTAMPLQEALARPAQNPSAP